MNITVRVHLGDFSSEKLKKYLLEFADTEKKLKKEVPDATMNVEIEDK